MEININIKKDDVVYTIEQCRINEYFVKGITIKLKEDTNVLGYDISPFVYLQVERYNNGVDSYTTQLRASECFLSKEELMKHLYKE